MNYVKAKNVLPSELLEKIQEYAAGTYLYIPQKCENRKNWGESKVETSKKFAIFTSISIEGRILSFSQFETLCFVTPSLFAS